MNLNHQEVDYQKVIEDEPELKKDLLQELDPKATGLFHRIVPDGASIRLFCTVNTEINRGIEMRSVRFIRYHLISPLYPQKNLV